MKENFYLNDYYQSKLTTRLWRTTRKLSLVFVATFILTGIVSAQYCTPAPTSVDQTGINNVTIGTTINNSTVAETGNYGNYSSMIAYGLIGTQVPFSFTLGTGWTYSYKVWIDWNNDFDFDDTGEEIFTGSTATGFSGNIAIASDAPAGTHRLRIGANDPSPTWGGGPTTPCYSLAYGAFEDYTLQVITEPLSCNAPFGLTSLETSPTSGTVSWTAPTPAPLGYEIYYNTTGVAPDASTTPSIEDIIGTTQIISDLAPFNTYYVYVRSVCVGEETAWIGPTSFYLGYCIPTTTWTGDHISSFSTTGATINVSTSAGSWSSAYTDYTSMVISHFPGGSFNFSTTYVGGTNGVNIWVDWNNNFEFEASELLFTQINNPAITSGTIAIPTETEIGNYRLRIRSQWGTGSNPPACDLVLYGEAEDYTLSIISPPSCVSPGSISGTAVVNGESDLTWQPSPTAGAIGYEWILVAQGGAPTDVPVASGSTVAGVTTATATGLTDFTVYTLYVRTDCDDDDLSFWAGPYNLPGPCTEAQYNLFPEATFEPTCNATLNIITTLAFGSEYSNVQVYGGEEYTFSSSLATDAITITNADASVVYAVGIGSISWTSNTDGVVRFYTHGPGCSASAIFRTKSVQCGEPWVNEADVKILYTLGGIPLVYGDEHQVQALISNSGTNDWTKEITLSITGANTFTDIFTLNLAVGQDSLITFAPFTASSTGTQTVSVSVEDDNMNDDNSYSVEQLVTPNLFSYKEPNAPIEPFGVGLNVPGNFVAKFHSSEAGDLNEIKVDFSGPGGVSYQYRVFAADGPNGSAQTILYESPVMVSAPGQAFLPISPAVPVNGDFYVGLRGLGVNFAFSYQIEDPLRTNTFFYNTDADPTWIDVATLVDLPARLAIEAQISTPTAPNCALNTLPINESVVCHMSGTMLSWASGGGAPTGYHLYFGTEEDPEFLADVTGTSYEIVDLDENSTYYWYVIPFNEFGDAECTEIQSFTASIDGCFCFPTYTNGTSDGDLISIVEILGTTLYNDSGTEEGTPSYTYYTGEPNYTAELQAGTSYELVVTVGSFGGQGVAAWIDYNDNGIFETNERIGYTTASVDGEGTVNIPIYLDCQAAIGTHRLRVRDAWNVAGVLIDPCINYGYGETEDYDVTIIAPPACPAPYGGQLTYVTDISATLTWNAGCTEELWNVHVAGSGDGVPTGDPSHPNVTSPLTVEGLIQFANYEFWVMAVCDDENSSDWAGPFYFSTLLFPPPANDNPCGAIALTISDECTYVIGTNENASNTPNVDEPSCSVYEGSDVWFSVVVPGNGIVTLDTEIGDIEDAAMAVYTAASCTGELVEIDCNDDFDLFGDDLMPYLELTDLEPNSTLYIRVFSYGNAEFGTFSICATSPCSAPSDAQIEVDVVNNTATISWVAMGNDATYTWELRESGEAGSGEIGLIDYGTTEAGVTSVTVTDLAYLSVYNFYILTNCSEESNSDWSSAQEVLTGLMPGCTDENACNYNPEAGVDDGSCIAEETTWYLDADGDGYGDAEVNQMACEGPEGYVSNGTDCDDDDETVWQSGSLYIDADGDGYDAGSETVCYGEDLPDGYSLNSEGTDCNDNNPAVWEGTAIEVSLQLPVTTICQNSPAFTLTGGSPTGGTWSGTGVSGSTFNPATAGAGTHTITYAVTGDGVCTSNGSASAAIVVETCPGVGENALNDIKLYPSHTNGIVNIVGTDLKEAVIMDLNGKLINTVSLYNTSVISMSEYSAGIYFVRVIGENKTKMFKVVRVN